MIVTTKDVFCDWPNCMNWVRGDVRINDSQARTIARKSGWTRHHLDGKLSDVCPMHKNEVLPERPHLQCEDEDCIYGRGHAPPHSHQEMGV